VYGGIYDATVRVSSGAEAECHQKIHINGPAKPKPTPKPTPTPGTTPTPTPTATPGTTSPGTPTLDGTGIPTTLAWSTAGQIAPLTISGLPRACKMNDIVYTLYLTTDVDRYHHDRSQKGRRGGSVPRA
jgi:hypothetical protein